MIGNKGKGFILFFVVIVISLGLFGTISYLFFEEKAKNKQLNEELTALQEERDSLDRQLGEAKNKVSDLQTSNSDAQRKIAQLTAEIEQQQQLSGRQIFQVQHELDQQRDIKSGMEKKLADSEASLKNLNVKIKGLETQLKELEAAKAALEQQVKGPADKQNVELGKIVVNQETVPALVEGKAKAGESKGEETKGIEGKILVLNREYNFAVINLGSKDGIAIGNVFSVYRNKKPVAELKVEKVHESMAAAGFTPEIKKKIAEGDRVELKSQ